MSNSKNRRANGDLVKGARMNPKLHEKFSQWKERRDNDAVFEMKQRNVGQFTREQIDGAVTFDEYQASLNKVGKIDAENAVTFVSDNDRKTNTNVGRLHQTQVDPYSHSHPEQLTAEEQFRRKKEVTRECCVLYFNTLTIMQKKKK